MTFREKPINKLYAFALAAVFAVALAGCGGGGGSAGNGDGDTMTTPKPTEAQKLAAAKTAAMTAYEAAKTALAAVMDDASHDMDSHDKAEEALSEAKAVNAVAQAATTSAAAEDAQAIVETARDNVVMYAGMVTAAPGFAVAAPLTGPPRRAVCHSFRGSLAWPARPGHESPKTRERCLHREPDLPRFGFPRMVRAGDVLSGPDAVRVPVRLLPGGKTSSLFRRAAGPRVFAAAPDRKAGA